MCKLAVWCAAPALIAAVAASAAMQSLGTIRYQVTDVGTLGGKSSYARAINASGAVVGNSDAVDGSTHAFVFAQGAIKQIDHNPRFGCYAFGVNKTSAVVGEMIKVTESKELTFVGFMYAGGKLSMLPALAGSSNWGCSINDNGDIAGGAYDGHHNQLAVVFRGLKVVELGSLGGGDGQARSINAKGDVVGESDTVSNERHAFLYSNGKMRDIGTLGGKASSANGINKIGDVVGKAETVRRIPHAFLYSQGKMRDIGTLGGAASEAKAVNGRGQVVGSAMTVNGADHAFLYEAGKMRDLNTEIDPNAGWVLTTAAALNDTGQIVGVGTIHGKEHGFVLTPVKK